MSNNLRNSRVNGNSSSDDNKAEAWANFSFPNPETGEILRFRFGIALDAGDGNGAVRQCLQNFHEFGDGMSMPVTMTLNSSQPKTVLAEPSAYASVITVKAVDEPASDSSPESA